MDRQLADLARDPGPPLRVAAWDGAGFNASTGSLYDTVLKTAGATNVANTLQKSSYGKPDIEILLLSAPSLLVKGAGVGRRPGLRENVERHPLIRRYWDGERHDFVPDTDTAFSPMLERFGLDQDRAVDAHIRTAVAEGANPEFFDWPDTRRGRTKARIVLRRLAAAGHEHVGPWRVWFDRAPVETDETEQ
ncbi:MULTISPECIES: hypothetical protein [unclassified Sphingopyxis]|nr:MULTISPECIES: hypothetical protein [unclassified Sphingopyxis]KTE64570.1 hypothetical protein ATE65_11210 [Sphingopyxis sp. H100]KTE69748.1 hypothetical protein ATE60_16170 [Sphingopyxis sp. H081]